MMVTPLRDCIACGRAMRLFGRVRARKPTHYFDLEMRVCPSCGHVSEAQVDKGNLAVQWLTIVDFPGLDRPDAPKQDAPPPVSEERQARPLRWSWLRRLWRLLGENM